MENKQLSIMKREEYPIEVRRMAQDIKDLLPNGNRLNDFEALALAKVGATYGLNPFNGEVWFLKDKDGTPRGIMAGIKGHRRSAHKEIEREGGAASNYWPEFDVMTPDQKKLYLIPDNALAFICRLYDTVTLRTYSETVERLFKAGAPWADIKNILGDRPFTSGVGFYTSGEPTKMKPHQCAMKRAEADALKRRFDLPFEGGAGTEGDNDTDNGNHPATVEDSPEVIEARMRAASKALYGDDGDGDLVTVATGAVDRGPHWTEPPAQINLEGVTEIPYTPDKWTIETANAVKTKKGTLLGEIGADGLVLVIEKTADDEIRSAAQFRLKWLEQNAHAEAVTE